MEDNLDQLKNSWKEAKRAQQNTDADKMLATVLVNHNRSKKAHLLNSLILGGVVLMLVAFFFCLAPMQETLSRVGIGLMIGGLIVRIIIELVSHQKAKKIDYSATSGESALQARDFYTYRKRIHGPITITIVVLYTLGFYSLTPEFAKYFSTTWMWLIDGSYLIIGTGLFLLIRKGVLQEMRDLRRINEIQSMLGES